MSIKKLKFYLHEKGLGFDSHVDDTELTAYWYNGPDPEEKLNCKAQICDGIVSDVTLSNVILVSTVPRNVFGSAVVLTVVPGTPIQLTVTLSPGGALNCMPGACQSNTILHVRVTSRPLTAG